MGTYVIKDVHEGFEFEWKVTLRPDRYPDPPMVACCQCNGNGYRWDDYDKEDCWRCGGRGKIGDPNWNWNPTPPKELDARLRKVYMEYWNEHQNKQFTLTGE